MLNIHFHVYSAHTQITQAQDQTLEPAAVTHQHYKLYQCATQNQEHKRLKKKRKKKENYYSVTVFRGCYSVKGSIKSLKDSSVHYESYDS